MTASENGKRTPRIRFLVRRGRWPAAIAGTVAAVTACLLGLAMSGLWSASAMPTSGRPGRAATAAASRPDMQGRAAGDMADPPVVAVTGSSGSGAHESARLISARTGRLVKVLAPVGSGNGFALSPDGGSVFVVGLHSGRIVVRQISVATGRISVLADGAYPSVSPDSRYLAYATGDQFSPTAFSSLAVRDLRTGTTRVISLAGLIGPKSSLLNQGTVAWLGDGTQVLAVPQPDAVAVSAQASRGVAAGKSGNRKAGNRCGQQRSPRGLCVIVVDVTAAGLSAHMVFVPHRFTSPFEVISGDYAAGQSFVVARMGGRSAGPIDEITLHGSVVTGRQIAALPRGALPVAFAPDADRVLYLVGHTPPALWVATIRDGRLTARHLLLTDNHSFGLDNAAW
ncbi:MAG TPA: hypothetical protein VLX31_19545 [Streptosporangiaceae bacterium]|nr:hypothetical protein [Streptosporangiaceae bacterium]